MEATNQSSHSPDITWLTHTLLRWMSVGKGFKQPISVHSLLHIAIEQGIIHNRTSEFIPAFHQVPPFVCEPHYEFDSSACYWTPGLEEDDIYSQMYHWKYREIPCNLITLSNRLGEGQFGEVFRAKWGIPPHGPVDVAVKLVKKGAPLKERLKLLQEAAILGQFRHRYVVSLLGVVTLGEPVSGCRN